MTLAILGGGFPPALAGNAGQDLPAAASAESGRVIYRQHCASRHGDRGEGAPEWHSPDARGELPAPPHDAEGHTWRHSDAELQKMIGGGWRDPFNKTDRLTMPAFGDVLSNQEIRDVIAYLKTLWSPEQRQYQIEESQAE